MVSANNVIRLLENKGIDFQVFTLPPEKLGANETARILGISPNIVFKTIVITREKAGKPILAVIPGSSEVDIKALAQVIGDKKVHLPTEREAESLTGLQAGGISPLALIHRGFLTILDSSADTYEQIHISGGQRGINIRLPVSALILLTNAKTASICKPRSTG
jgi:Cys-tRNA(Pro)/Cys-tRNA(Cys) deacylase